MTTLRNHHLYINTGHFDRLYFNVSFPHSHVNLLQQLIQILSPKNHTKVLLKWFSAVWGQPMIDLKPPPKDPELAPSLLNSIWSQAHKQTYQKFSRMIITTLNNLSISGPLFAILNCSVYIIYINKSKCILKPHDSKNVMKFENYMMFMCKPICVNTIRSLCLWSDFIIICTNRDRVRNNDILMSNSTTIITHTWH